MGRGGARLLHVLSLFLRQPDPGKTVTYSDVQSFTYFTELFMSVTAAKGQIDILSLYEKTLPEKLLISNIADTKEALPLTAEQLAQLNMEFAPLRGCR